MRRRHLQRLAVAHHRLGGHGVDGAGESLTGRLDAEVRRRGEHRLEEVVVDLEVDLRGKRVGVLVTRVGRVALLPEELRGAQEQPRAQLPTDHVAPLVEQQRQVTVALDPLGHVLANDGLRGRTHHDRFGQFFATRVRDDGQFGAESLDVLGLALEVTERDEEGEIGILGPGLLDSRVHLGLHPLPDRPPVGADHHRAAHRSVVGHLALGDDVLIPAREVFALRGQNTLSHDSPLIRGDSLAKRRFNSRRGDGSSRCARWRD